MESLFPPAVIVAFAITIGAGMATVLGSFLVIWARQTNTRLLAFGLAFSGGAMVYVSLVEIFVKANESFAKSADPKTAYMYATLFFFVGVAILFAIDRFVPNPHTGFDEKRVRAAAADTLALKRVPALKEAGPDAALARIAILAAVAITLHNLPEGLATFFATLDNPTVGLPLAIAIAVHNIPEGVSIAVPVYYATGSKSKAVLATAVSGFAEPLGALIGYLALASILTPFVFGAVFAVIAGAMVFLALDELLPAARVYARGHETVYGILVGMGAMAVSLVLFK
ncbi:MAG: zinc transporter ZupT [Beijerinckiaceae bacterium]|nr:zinc transporter ZupT [Beijerinckiaceae bacterium]